MTARRMLPGLLMSAALAAVSAAHEVLIVPIGDEQLVPITVADEHATADPAEIDFGEALVGSPLTRSFVVDNVSTQTQSVTVTLDDPSLGIAFGAGDDAFELASGAAPREIEVLYTPISANAGFQVTATVTATDPLGHAQETAVVLSGSAIDSFVTVSPPELDFGEVLLSTTATIPLGVLNQSGTIQTVTMGFAPSLGVQPPISFAPSAGPLDVGVGEERIIDVAYMPASATDHLDTTLELTSVAANGAEQVVPIRAVGVVTQSYARVSPQTLDFGSVILGEEATLPFRVLNLSRGPVSVQVILPDGQPLLLGAGDEEFALGVGDIRDVDVTFAPQTVDHPPLTRITVLVFNEDGYVQRFFVELMGQGVEPVASLRLEDRSVPGLEVSEITFDPSAEVGDFLVEELVLINDGDLPVSGRITGFIFGGLACWYDLCVHDLLNGYPQTFDLEPGESIDFDVELAPSRAWAPTTQPFSFTGADEPVPFAVHFQAADPNDDEIVVDGRLYLDKVEHDFGVLFPGETAQTTITLSNGGTAPVSDSIRGLDPGGSCRSSVCFSPTTYNLQPGGPPQVITLTFGPESEMKPFLSTVHFGGGSEPVSFTARGAAWAGGGAQAAGGPGAGTVGLTPIPLDTDGMRGLVNENTFLSGTDFDSISTMTGNLVVTLPIGQRLRIGPSYSHGLTWVYNLSSWDAATTTDGLPWGRLADHPSSSPAYGSNAGLGGLLSLGQLYERDTRFGGGVDPDVAPHYPLRAPHAPYDWLYVAPDGSRIYFEPTAAADVFVSKGTSFLRLTQDTPDIAGIDLVTLEFSDGVRHTFAKTGLDCDNEGRCWRLERMEDAFGNFATVEYDPNSGDPNRPLVKIHYPGNRTTTITLNRNTGRGGGSTFELGDMRWAVESVSMPSFGDGTQPATYTFQYEPQSLLRGCPGNYELPDPTMTVPLLTEIVLPNDESYRMKHYFKTGPDEETPPACDPKAGALEEIVTPTDGKVFYEYMTWHLPSACKWIDVNNPADEDGVPISSSTGVARRELRVRQGPGPDNWVTRAYTAYHSHLDHLVTFATTTDNRICERENTVVTDVVHGPNVGSETDAHFKVQRFYHAATRPLDGYQSEGTTWNRSAYGLPINQKESKPLQHYAGRAYLSSETADCEVEAFDPNPALCTVKQRTYRRYLWVPGGGGNCINQNGPDCQRRREAVEAARDEHDANYVETRWHDYDGRGHFRLVKQRSDFHDSTQETRETTSYLGGTGLSGLEDSLPAPGDPWLLELYTEKRSRTTGIDRVVEFDFDPATGFLSCRRTWSGTSRAGNDFLLKLTETTSTANGEKGNVGRQELGGGDGAGLNAGEVCPALAGAIYRTDYAYQNGERHTATPVDGAGSAIGPQTLYQEIDEDTGLVSAACSFAVDAVPSTGSLEPLCERYVYDKLGRRTKIDRGYRLNVSTGAITLKPAGTTRLADTTFTYLTGDGATLRASLGGSGGSTVVELDYDALGRPTGDSWDSSEGRMSSTIFTHGRGFKTAEVSPKLAGLSQPAWKAMCSPDGNSTVSCRTQYIRHDVFGSPEEVRSPVLEEGGSERIQTFHARGSGGQYETVRRFHGNGKTHRRTAYDHLGRVWKVTEWADVPTLEDPADVNRTTLIEREGNETRTKRYLDSNPAGDQIRTAVTDGRGFLLSETQPEWGGNGASYTYDSAGNVLSQVRPDGTQLAYVYDALGRLHDVFLGPGTSVPLKALRYDATTGRLITAKRFNRWTCEATLNYPTCESGGNYLVIEGFSYDDNGSLASKRTSLWAPNAGGLRYLVEQGYEYDDRGQLETVHYPDCPYEADPYGNLPAWCGDAASGVSSAGAPEGRSLSYGYEHGALTSIGLDGTLMAAHGYHWNGMLKEVQHYDESGAAQWSDEVSTGDYGIPHVRRIRTFWPAASGGGVVWDSGDYDYDSRGNLRGIGSQRAYLLDYLDRLAYYNKSGTVTTYDFDEFDNLVRKGSSALNVDRATNRLTTAAGEAVVYDANGHLTQIGDRSLVYDPFGKIRGYFDDAPGSDYDYQAAFLYTAGDERVVMGDRTPAAGGGDRNLTIFFARGPNGRVLRELHWTLDSKGLPSYDYRDYFWSGTDLRSMEDGDGRRYQAHLDHLGSPRLLSEGPDYRHQEELEPWGNREGVNQIPIRIGFTGHERNRDDLGAPATEGYSETYNFGARTYQPSLGRFLTPDPARDASSWSLYGYAGNSPAMNVDPTGLESQGSGGASGGSVTACGNNQSCRNRVLREERLGRQQEENRIEDEATYSASRQDNSHDEGITMQSFSDLGPAGLYPCAVACDKSPLKIAKDVVVAGFITLFALAGGLFSDLVVSPVRLSDKVNEQLKDKARAAQNLQQGHEGLATVFPLTTVALSAPLGLLYHALGGHLEQEIFPFPVPEPPSVDPSDFD